MPPLVFISPEGRVLSDDKPTTSLNEVQPVVVNEPLHIIAARQHAKDSTKKDTNKQS